MFSRSISTMMNFLRRFFGKSDMLEDQLVKLGFSKLDNRWVNVEQTIVLPRLENEPELMAKYLKQIAFNIHFTKPIRLRYYYLYEKLFTTPKSNKPPRGSSPNNR